MSDRDRMSTPATQHTLDWKFVPVPLPEAQDSRRLRHALRSATVAFALIAPFVSWGVLSFFIIPKPAPSISLLLVTFACPMMMLLAGALLILSVRAGLGVSLVALIAGTAVTARWLATSQLDSGLSKLALIVILIGPAAIATILTIVLYRLRRARMHVPLL